MIKSALVYSSTLNLRGGAEANASFLVRSLLSLGYAVCVFSETEVKGFDFTDDLLRSHPRAFIRPKWLPLMMVNGVVQEDLAKQRVINTVHNSPFAFFLTSILLLLRIVELKIVMTRVKPTIVLFSITNINNLLLARISRKVPIVFWSHTPLSLVPAKMFRPINSLIRKTLIESHNAIILANSQLMLANLDPYLQGVKAKVLSVPCAVDSPEIKEADEKEGGSIVIVSRIDRHKRIHEALEVVDIMSKKMKIGNFVLRVVGDVQDRCYLDEIRKTITLLRLNHYVKLIPDGRQETVKSALRKSQLLWNFSEGYGSRINLEAMAYGCIPIVTPNMVDDVPFDQSLACSTSTDFANRTGELLRNAQELMLLRKKAQSFVYENHGLQKFEYELKEILRS